MAEYTIELRRIIPHRNIFDFPYPFYDESKRRDFEERFKHHFYFREIGCETVDRFIFYLKDKMNTVFPYYNELFKASLIEYSVLDNYSLTETITREQESKGQSSGISSTVGRVQDEQQTTTSDNVSGGSENSHSETSKTDRTKDTDFESFGSSETVGSSETNTTETVNGETTHSSQENSEAIKRFLDTPQGKLNLTDSKYLTSLNHDNTTSDTSESGTNKQTNTGKQTGSNSSEGETTTSSNTSETESGGSETSATDSATHHEQRAGNASFTGEQKTTSDNNTRAKTEGIVKETITTLREGNIGVDADSDMIQKHIKLQKTLATIEAQFFEECEDLFMQIL